MGRLFLLLACMGWQVLPLTAAERPSEQDVYWLVSDFRPFMILSGPGAGEGYLDQAQSLFQQLLPLYWHKSVQGNVSRRERIMQDAAEQGGQICSVTLFRTPKRERFLYFTRPYVRILPSGVIILKSLLPRFQAFRDQAGYYRLRDMLAEPGLKLGLTQQRAYGAGVDSLLETMGETRPAHVIWRSGEDNSEGLYGMLQRGRIHYTLGYAVEEQYLYRLDKTHEATVFLPLAENPGLLDAPFSCARTPWGARTVQEVDLLLADPALQARFQQQYEAWLGAEALQLYRSLLAPRMP